MDRGVRGVSAVGARVTWRTQGKANTEPHPGVADRIADQHVVVVKPRVCIGAVTQAGDAADGQLDPQPVLIHQRWGIGDDLGDDGTHPSRLGQDKVAHLLLNFFKTDSLAESWFRAKK